MSHEHLNLVRESSPEKVIAKVEVHLPSLRMGLHETSDSVPAIGQEGITKCCIWKEM